MAFSTLSPPGKKTMKIYPCLPLFFLTLFSLSCTLEIDFPNRCALVYGIADYLGDSNDLNYTADDADQVGDLLSSKGFDVKTGTNSSVTAAQIESDLTDIEQKSCGLLLFYFSGHGGHDEKGSYLVLADNRPLYARELAELIAKSGCEKAVIIIDSCYSGGFIGEEYDREAYPDDWEGELWPFISPADSISAYFSGGSDSGISPGQALVISASGSEEESYESPAIGHGYFTKGILDGAVSGDENSDGYISSLELYSYARSYVSQYSFESSERSLPRISGGAVDFILFRQ